jgi:hypothetical protein
MGPGKYGPTGGKKMNVTTFIFTFADAIQQKRLISLKFKSKGNGRVLLRTCTPLDIAPSKRTKSGFFKIHFWDYGGAKPHVLSLNPDQIIDFDVLDDQFRPEEFITWNTVASRWCVQRSWGIFS